MIVIIDYGAGNLRSVVNAFEFIGEQPLVTNAATDLLKAHAIVLPGVGSFREGMLNLERLNLIEPLNEMVIEKRIPYFGICLGLQFLASTSTEHGETNGLGWIPGTVERIRPCEPTYRVPHMGWNNVRNERSCRLYKGLEQDSVFYFVHSYSFTVAEDSAQMVTGTSWHGQVITASLNRDNIFGVQFHPEKSQRNGLKLIENFVNSIQ